MGKRYHHEITGSLSPSNQALVVHQVNEVRGIALRTFALKTSHRIELIVLFAYQVLPQSTLLDPQPNPTIFTPPSRSPSPLSLSPRESNESLRPTPADGGHIQESDSSDSRSDCSDRHSESSEASTMVTVSAVRENLASKRLFYDDEEALKRGGQAMKEKALEIMRSQRHSPTSKDNAPELKEVVQRFSSSSERTLVHNLWCILKGKYRDVIDDTSPKNDDTAIEWVKRAWKMDFLECVYEIDLNKDSIPDTSNTASFSLYDGWNRH